MTEIDNRETSPRRRKAVTLAGMMAAVALAVAALVPASPASADPAEIEVVKPPVIKGDVYWGGTLTVTDPVWSEPAVKNTYQWLVDGAKVMDGLYEPATGKSFVVPTAIGSTVSIVVTGSKAGFDSQTVEVARKETVRLPRITNTKIPKIKGPFRVGRTVTATDGEWDQEPFAGPVADVYLPVVYEWLLDGKRVKSTTTPEYVIPAKARGKRLSVRVTVPYLSFLEATATSKSTRVKVNTFATKRVRIAGKPVAGKILEARATWSTTGVKSLYQWKVGGKTVSRTRHYAVTEADKGKKISLRVTGTKAGYRTVKVNAKKVVIAAS